MLTLIAAVARNGVIGASGTIPWKVPGELGHFKATTMGHPLIMGRATFDSIGKVLPGRRTIVLTRDRSWHHADVEVAASVPDALTLAGPVGPIFVAGGGQVYAESMPLAQRLLISQIDAEPEGDTFFPAIDPARWQEVSREPREGWDLVDYRRR